MITQLTFEEGFGEDGWLTQTMLLISPNMIEYVPEHLWDYFLNIARDHCINGGGDHRDSFELDDSNPSVRRAIRRMETYLIDVNSNDENTAPSTSIRARVCTPRRVSSPDRYTPASPSGPPPPPQPVSPGEPDFALSPPTTKPASAVMRGLLRNPLTPIQQAPCSDAWRRYRSPKSPVPTRSASHTVRRELDFYDDETISWASSRDVTNAATEVAQPLDTAMIEDVAATQVVQPLDSDMRDEVTNAATVVAQPVDTEMMDDFTALTDALDAVINFGRPNDDDEHDDHDDDMDYWWADNDTDEQLSALAKRAHKRLDDFKDFLFDHVWLPMQRATTMADLLYEKVERRFGEPRYLHCPRCQLRRLNDEPTRRSKRVRREPKRLNYA